MVAKCAHAACNNEFRGRSKGSPFLFPPDHDFQKSRMAGKSERMVDYGHWLYPACAGVHTIARYASRVVVSERVSCTAPSDSGTWAWQIAADAIAK